MSSGYLTDAALSDLMVEIFSATHRSGKYIPGEEPLLGTSTCRLSGVDLSLDWHSPEAAHAAHSREVQNAAKEAFEEHLLPLDMPCKYHSQGPTKKKNPRLCEFARFKTRYEQVCHVLAHTLTLHKQHHAVGNIPYGEWVRDLQLKREKSKEQEKKKAEEKEAEEKAEGEMAEMTMNGVKDGNAEVEDDKRKKQVTNGIEKKPYINGIDTK